MTESIPVIEVKDLKIKIHYTTPDHPKETLLCIGRKMFNQEDHENLIEHIRDLYKGDGIPTDDIPYMTIKDAFDAEHRVMYYTLLVTDSTNCEELMSLKGNIGLEIVGDVLLEPVLLPDSNCKLLVRRFNKQDA